MITFFFISVSEQFTIPTEEMGIVMNPQHEQELDSQILQQEKQHEDLVWSREATLLMLSCYKPLMKKIDAGKMRKKKAFAEVSEKLQNQMFFYTAEQCSGRLKTLLRAYKIVKDHNKKSGNLDDMFGDKPNVSPVCTIGSNDSNGDQTVEDWGVDDPDAENEESEEPEETRKAQKRSASVTETNEDSKRESKRL